ncbi:MAG: aspartate carbamoyltransferase regulatory subunit [Candidatus Diapherotrites archaeon]|uniref:Aspartate carbamoyltransferase regulatory chain n=1 Tax=Candidatus Iainarchaeum sp. TaxID=3101447 RepID=A0A938YW83_9ARCH|nr:aspartate carbamoyltransferase regulatory subunit [Candidatus Diapherotrites archaeon]
MNKDDIRLTPISNGTVLDHLPVGTALRIIEILGLEKAEDAVTVAINTESKSLGRKDLMFIEGKALTKEEIDKIGLIAENGTMNIIEKKEVKKKEKISLPKQASGLIKCVNPKCITNIESLPTKFTLTQNPLKAKCQYCEKTISGEEIFKAIQ